MTALTIVITVLTVLLFLAAAYVKFADTGAALHTRQALGIPVGRYRLIGVAEVAGAVGALVGLGYRPLGIAALAGLVLVALGACGAQIRLRNPWAEARTAVLALILSAAALVLQIVT